ncbi:hypothetical protein N7476_003455 [Penicillium atrosanguineum]|uniref:Uncharacterized protein n=1 Tax=Penicillium atrosanguineum TaxID=1132637 RepID=A0A9W9Q5F8_9EURO|nr:hypothetical protein N7526_004681 [Penicillium atrosanguineum]KAJ5324855.1 hypothetical protein N7476_003455 [Penicillium atrosanguineum]
MEQSKDDYRLSYVRLDDAPEAERTRQRPLSTAEQVFLQSQTQGFWGASWTLEILGCLTSIGFLVAIIVILFNFDGRPMPDWPHGITLNTLVSVFSTVMKATMAFVLTESLAQLKWSWFRGGNKLSDLALLDAASRGAMGAFIVLTRFLPRHLVTFGCFILVLAAACDPFVQQVIGINAKPIHTPGRSSIQVCNASLYSDYGEGAGPGMNEVPLSTNGAIYSGLFQTQAPNSKDILASCPTGNCTFPKYQSLGFCSKCANVTDFLHLNKTPLGTTLSTYNYKLPNGLSFSTAESMMYMMNATYNLDLLKINADGLPLILNFTAITSPGYGVPPAVQISATECALYFCVSTYEARVTEGVFSENRTAVASSSNTSTSWIDATDDFVITPDTCFFNGTRYKKPYTSPQDCIYSVNWLSRLAMQNSLSPLMKGEGTLFVSNRPSWTPSTAQAIYGTYGNLTDISTMFESMASSLTLNARSKVCSASVNGTTWTMQSFVQVRWKWLILPGALVVLSLVFLVVTVVHTKNQYIWKSSPLALLFSDLSIDSSGPLKTSPTLRSMEDTSRKMEVWLESSAEGIKLKAIPS